MWRRRAEVPFWRERSGRFIPLIISLMVFLAALVLVTTMALDDAVRTWQRAATGTLTVQIPAPPEAMSDDDERSRIEGVMGVLEAISAIEKARVLPREETMSLLEPWIGQGNLSDSLPLPTVIDVSLRRDRKLDPNELRRGLAAVVSGASVDHHEQWLGQLMRLVQTVQFIGIAVVFLIGLAAVVIVVFATRAGFAMHRDVIELLHVIGARDSYIANQFEGHALWLGLRGGLYGVAMALATIFLLAQLAVGLEGPFWVHFELSRAAWIALTLLPAITALITVLTVRLTVLRALRGIV